MVVREDSFVQKKKLPIKRGFALGRGEGSKEGIRKPSNGAHRKENRESPKESGGEKGEATFKKERNWKKKNGDEVTKRVVNFPSEGNLAGGEHKNTRPIGGGV